MSEEKVKDFDRLIVLMNRNHIDGEGYENYNDHLKKNCANRIHRRIVEQRKIVAKYVDFPLEM